MSDTVQDNIICHILPGEESCRAIEQELADMERPLKSMVLTWQKVRREYRLEIILTEDVAEGSAVPEMRCVTVGSIGECEYDALNKLFLAGRRTFPRLKKKFPMMRCKLSIYRFLPKEGWMRRNSQNGSRKRPGWKEYDMPL